MCSSDLVITAAQQEAEQLGDAFVSTEHLLLGLSLDSGPAGKALRDNGAGHDALKAALPSVRGDRKVTTADPENTFQALEKFSTDLTEMARSGKQRSAGGQQDRKHTLDFHASCV